jgi:uncharacterized protein YlaI
MGKKRPSTYFASEITHRITIEFNMKLNFGEFDIYPCWLYTAKIFSLLNFWYIY